MRRARIAAIVASAVTLGAILTSCSNGPSDVLPMPVPTASQSPSAGPTDKPNADPTLLAGGTALANLDFFNFVNQRLLAVNSSPSSAAIVENLVNAGFATADIEITPDKTDQLRIPADSIQVSVRTSKDCLLGQFQGGVFTSAIGAPVNGSNCLIGATEAIQ